MNVLTLVMLMSVGQIAVDHEFRPELPEVSFMADDQTGGPAMEMEFCPYCGKRIAKQNGAVTYDAKPRTQVVRYTIPTVRYWTAPAIQATPVAYAAPPTVVQYSQRYGLFGLRRQTWTAIQPNQAYGAPIQGGAYGGVWGGYGRYQNYRGNGGAAYGGGTPYRTAARQLGRCGGGNCRR